MVIGLVGKSGTGKNFISNILEKKGFTCIDVDIVAHKVLDEKKEELVSYFGNVIIGEDGTVQRKILSPIVFQDAKKLEKLNSIIHPRTRDIIEEITKASKDTVINAALLEPMDLAKFCDVFFLVTADKEIRYNRLVKREGISREQFERRDYFQQIIGKDLEKYNKPIFTIINNEDESSLCRQIDNYCDTLQNRGIYE